MATSSQTRTVPVSCPLDCGGGCPLLAQVRRGRIRLITVNPLGGKFLQGCLKGFRAARTVEAPDRLLHPLIRTGPRGSGRFRQAGWDEALNLIADRMLEIRSRYGPEAVLNLGGSGSWRAALHTTSGLTKRFLALFGGYTGRIGSYSSQAYSFTAPYVLGTLKAGSDPATIEDSRLILLWGANPAEARMGPEWMPRLRRAREKGAQIVVLDPRRTGTAKQLEARWVGLRPNTDTALMLALLHVLVTEKLLDLEFIDRCSVGFQAIEDRVMGRAGKPAATPQWAARICGLGPETIIGLARDLGRAKPAALIPGLSIQRTLGGEDTVRLAVTLQTATGNIGRSGGWAGVFPYGATSSPRLASLPHPPNPSGLEIPVYSWADAVLQGRAGGWPSDLKAIYSLGANYLVQGADLAKNIRAFEQAELTVCHDLFMTPTARYCDVVLPTAHFLERSDMVTPAGGDYLLYSGRAVSPRAGLPTDYRGLARLAKLMGFGPEFTEGRTSGEWLERLMEDSEVGDPEEFKRTGLYRRPGPPRVGLAAFAADPRAHPLDTPSGKIELTSPEQTGAGFTPVPDHREWTAGKEYPFRLVTPKTLRRVHSQGFNLDWSGGPEEQRLWLNPADATVLGLSQGSEALVESEVGRVRVSVRVTGDIRSGTACLIEGAWPLLDGSGVERAGSANALTSTSPTRPSRGSRTHSVAVRIKPVGKDGGPDRDA